MWASVVIVTMSDTPLAEKFCTMFRPCVRILPVVVRTIDERDMVRLTKAGAAEVGAAPVVLGDSF